MSASGDEFPPAALFASIVVCPWREQSPRIDGSLADWSSEHQTPPLGELSGGEQFATLALAWNERGLYVAFEVPKDQRLVTNRESPASGDAVELFIDTRASRSSHRASQFCYHLIVLPAPPGRATGEPVAWQRPMRRALQRSPQIDFDEVRVASRAGENGYSIEMAFAPEALHGFEAVEGARMGMAAVVHDIQRGRQYWGTSPDFPYERDPSTWAIVELGGKEAG